ncbi:DNA polymerase III subunit chi [Oleiphilus messinensis]|uniref:DNA polymerase III subunit chi n=1 Tax=Oleiphilus messinensis TaxID=141451 RepID=A0A1Y0IAT9_9GAMM|nr:DNA polymerase III subunit chi [Oleiphilus messinensis]ARU57618.1 DNA polymerase III subunit chi [Oleiphilus messinensis]
MLERADFYILKSDREIDRYNYVCRLTEMAYTRGMRTHILTDSTAEAEHLDELLWNFKLESFIPHEIAVHSSLITTATTGDTKTQAPVLIYTTALDKTETSGDLVINMSASLPHNIDSYSRLAEIASQSPPVLKQVRSHFRQLKTSGVTINIHDFSSNT